MSISTLFARGRQSNSNLHANTLTIAALTSDEVAELTPEEVLVAYNTTTNSLLMYANGVWNTITYNPPTGKFFALWTLTSNASIPSAGAGVVVNPCNSPIPGNTYVRMEKGGADVNPAGYITIPKAGIYKIEGTVTLTPAAVLIAGSVALCICNFNGTANYAEAIQNGFTGPGQVSFISWTLSVSAFVPIEAGSSIAFFFANTNTGQNITVGGAGASDPMKSWFSVEFVTD